MALDESDLDGALDTRIDKVGEEVWKGDANLGGYDVSTKEVADMIKPYQPPPGDAASEVYSSAGSSGSGGGSGSSNQYVNTHIIFLAEPRAAQYFIKDLPSGIAHNCAATKDLPGILKQIIESAS